LWAAPSTTDADRKEVIRAVIDEITIAIRGRSELVDVTVGWAGGQQTHEVIRRPIQRSEDLSYYPHLASRITGLAGAGWDPGRIADQLNTEGFLPARGAGPIRHRLVTQILHRAGTPVTHRWRASHFPDCGSFRILDRKGREIGGEIQDVFTRVQGGSRQAGH
jgi:hypothetical protein